MCNASAGFVPSGAQCEKCWAPGLCWLLAVVTFCGLIAIAVYLVWSAAKGAKHATVSTISRIFLNYLQMVMLRC